MTASWHYAKGGTKHGPITAAQLKELANTGQLSPDDLVWREDMKEWRKASTVKGLFSEQAPVPSAATEAMTSPSVTASIKPASSIPKPVKYGALGCGGLLVLMAVCSGILTMLGFDPPVSGPSKGALNVPFDHRLSGVDDATYESLTEAVKSKDAMTIAEALKGRDPYSLFSSEELKALRQPVTAPNWKEPWRGSLVCLSSPPSEFQFGATYTASFHREGDNGSYTEIKTVRFEADTKAEQWVVKEIRWVVHDSTLLVIYPYWKDRARIDKAVCMTPRQVTQDRPGQEDVVPWKREKQTKTLADYMANVHFSIQFNDNGTFEIENK